MGTTSGSSDQFHHEDWTFDLYFIQAVDPGYFCGVADISRARAHRCKLVLNRPATTRAEGVALLRAQCLAWVAAQEIASAGGK